MVDVSERSALYRAYVLVVLLLVGVSNLATRHLPSYLATVQVPGCQQSCSGVHVEPLCGSQVWDSFPSDREPTEKEACQLCRARLEWVPPGWVPPHAGASSSLRPRTVAGRQLAERAGNESSAAFAGVALGKFLRNSSAPPQAERPNGRLSGFAAWRAVVKLIITGSEEEEDQTPFEDSSGTKPVVMDASFYNMADSTCLKHWEYGVLIGYGFTLIFAVGSVPAGSTCDRKPRVALAGGAVMAWSVATAMQASANSFHSLLICRAVMGLAQAFAVPAAVSLTADYFRERQNVAEMVLSVGLYLGSGCASFSILFAQVLGWRWTVFLAGLAGLPVAALLIFTVAEPERTEWSAPCPLDVVAYEVFEKSRVARLLIAATSAKMLAAYSMSAFLPIWYSRRALAGFTSDGYASWNALAISGGGLLSAVVGCACSHLWSRYDPRAPCWIGLLGSLGSLPLIWLVLCADHFTTSIVCLFFLLLVGESWFGPSMTLLQASVRRSVRSQAVSMLIVASTLAANIGPALLGALDPGGQRIGFHLLWISLLANVAAAAAFTWTAREIGLDPVAAGICGDKFGGGGGDAAYYRGPYGAYGSGGGIGALRAMAGNPTALVPPRATTQMGFF